MTMKKNTGRRLGGGPNGPSLTIPPGSAPMRVIRTANGKIEHTKNTVQTVSPQKPLYPESDD